MNMPTQRDFLAQKEYYQDQMRAAAQYRLAREAQAGRERNEPFYASAMHWLGQRLVAWGQDLQGRFSAPVPQSR
jgi:hypothetical protein